MKVTLTAEQAASFKDARERANKGCRVCPCCKAGLYKPYYYRTKVFRNELYRFDLYRCDKCDAEWESEAYKICLNT